MELAAHWHRCQNLPKKRVNTLLVYRERDAPVNDGLVAEGNLVISFSAAKAAREQS